MIQVDLLIINAAQIVTCANTLHVSSKVSPKGPKRGSAMADVGLIKKGAVAVTGSKIVAVGTADLQETYTAKQTIDASGKVVCPGFVDPHTHVVYAGDRVNEFELRIKGATYQEIMAAGGGIVSTTRAVREASVEELAADTRTRLDAMLKLGTTTVEIKTGYGLETTSELKMLQVIEELALTHPVDIVPTFLGAHAIPMEYRGRTDAFTDLVVNEMLPQAAEWYQDSWFRKNDWPFFNDVFCEQNAFDLEQSRRVLEAGLAKGMQPKIHADEFSSLGGVVLAVELNAVSADHLDVTPPEERVLLASSNTIGVVLPLVNVNFGSAHFANARAFIDAGAALALSTDINPGSAPSPSIPLTMAVACRYQHLLPAEVMNAVTINAAHAIGLGDKLGSIEAGKQADLLIVDSHDYRHLAYQFGGNLVRMVLKKGEIVSGHP